MSFHLADNSDNCSNANDRSIRLFEFKVNDGRASNNNASVADTPVVTSKLENDNINDDVVTDDNDNCNNDDNNEANKILSNDDDDDSNQRNPYLTVLVLLLQPVFYKVMHLSYGYNWWH